MDVSGVVLAGGASRRLGVNKAYLTLKGKTFLELAVEKLRALCTEVLVVGNHLLPQAGLGACFLEEAEDGPPHPARGLRAALRHASCGTCLVLAVDLPLVRGELLQGLLSEREGASLVLPEVNGFLEPLVGLYRRSLLPSLEAVGFGQGLKDWARSLPPGELKVIPEAKLRRWDAELASFLNVNTWADYERLKAYTPHPTYRQPLRKSGPERKNHVNEKRCLP
ncbi:MAG: molybdenum cofactor guanylyltransferase [Bacillota bacterium]|nr:molybdenum cofactor guanylyltransferase [Bacillota bacterium]MDK2856844.1 molybdenum cofactor guanylyltransferase [Bacillota bacterium]MDK2926174.1 molybdenum cofactor guanylyltransferase [Bacillota bacterium]